MRRSVMHAHVLKEQLTTLVSRNSVSILVHCFLAVFCSFLLPEQRVADTPVLPSAQKPVAHLVYAC